jgi:hypothetical protein
LSKSLPIESGSNHIADLLDEKVQSYAEGGLPHASEALVALIDSLSNGNTGGEPGVSVSASVSRDLFSVLGVVLISFVQDKEYIALLAYTEGCT